MAHWYILHIWQRNYCPYFTIMCVYIRLIINRYFKQILPVWWGIIAIDIVHMVYSTVYISRHCHVVWSIAYGLCCLFYLYDLNHFFLSSFYLSINLGQTRLLRFYSHLPFLPFCYNPLNTWRNNDVVITSKRRHCDVIMSQWRRFDVITTSFLRNVSALMFYM